MNESSQLRIERINYSDQINRVMNDNSGTSLELIQKREAIIKNIIVYIHGGGLVKGDMSSGSYLSKFTEEGLATVCLMNYPLQLTENHGNLIELQLESIKAGTVKDTEGKEYPVKTVQPVASSSKDVDIEIGINIERHLFSELEIGTSR